MNRLLSNSSGYQQVSDPVQTVGIKSKDLEMNEVGVGVDLGSDVFFDEVTAIRTSIRELEASISDVKTKQLSSLSHPSTELTNQIDALSLSLTTTTSTLTKRIDTLGRQVGSDEAKRGHWDTLKSSLGRVLSKLQMIGKEHRAMVRDRVKRQFLIVKPDATDEEVQQVLEAGNGGQIFAQAVASSRSEEALAALSEAKDRRSALLKLEANMVELAALFTQVQALVASQNQQFITIDEAAMKTESDMATGVKQIGSARLSAAAARHKRKLCAAFAGVLLIVLVVVIVVSIKGGSGPSSTPEPTPSDVATASAPPVPTRWRV